LRNSNKRPGAEAASLFPQLQIETGQGHLFSDSYQRSGIAQELYFRLQENSHLQKWREYSQGPEAQTGGLQDPELSMPHPELGKMLSASQPGQLWPPTRLGEWLVIVRLEKPAQLDERMQAQLLNSLFEAWLSEQLNQLDAVRIQNTPKALVSL